MGDKLIRFNDDGTLIPVNRIAAEPVLTRLLAALELQSHLRGQFHLQQEDRAPPHLTTWQDVQAGPVDVKIGSTSLCTLQIVRTSIDRDGFDPIVSPTQPWDDLGDDPDLDRLVEAQANGPLHVIEHVWHDGGVLGRVKVLLLQQDCTYEWIENANVERLGNIPFLHANGQHRHFFCVHEAACQSLLGTCVVIAIQGRYDPVDQNRWVLLAGGIDTKWCKICQLPRTVTPQQCHQIFDQQCRIIQRNLMPCASDQPLMLINGDLLWCDSRLTSSANVAFGGMDLLDEAPSCNVDQDATLARLLNFNLDPAALAADELVFHFDILQMLMPSICWCPPGRWMNCDWQFRFPHEPMDLQVCYGHFIVPILADRDWIFPEVRIVDELWRILFHSPEPLTALQRTGLIELTEVMGIEILPGNVRWLRTVENPELSAWYTLRTFYARSGAPLLQTSVRTSMRLQRSFHQLQILQILDQADRIWRAAQTDDRTMQFGLACRSIFLLALAESLRRIHAHLAGGRSNLSP